MTHSTLIIGAGPAGLAMAGQLAHRNPTQPTFTVLEASEYVGVAWRNHYDRLHLHTVKEHSALPHLPYPSTYPTYVSRLEFVEYLEQYAEHFRIQPLFNQPVQRISRLANGHWQVATPTDTFEAERVVVATGYNRIPNKPDLPGLRDFRGIVWHSHEYRNGAAFSDENVLVIGMGNTGAEVALDLLEHGARPTISVRGPISIVRRDMFGKPTQPSAIFLNKFPNWFYDFVAGLSQRLTVGDLSAYGLGKPTHPPSYLIREKGRIPVIDQGTLAEIKAGRIAVAPSIERINARTVTFSDGSERPFDAIVLATGYRPGLQPVLGEALCANVLNERGYPKSLWFDEPELKGLYFLGFKTPLTGILRSLNIDSGQIAAHIQKQMKA
ncbi:SidA/IucD/PvdA family monooxygenase [Rudanella paleaurantiibacter]|uniref:SidA/IucD/PvdA family monooxygenase n=1 Tax=Rudanella paleaurantiibacter TaxID=2614655 RepID=A0A7J5TYY5_9BACT|nr:NAD(P)/FAD-dependent oxidoreductase [Rudanella paleaurantiibacter]KAB7730333.1 SidA/IucD/PvdA family monooxygenase [Rudanella paleaurantiibacter]